MGRYYQLTVRKTTTGTLTAMIECEAFADSEEGFDSMDEVFGWAQQRTSQANDPFEYDET